MQKILPRKTCKLGLLVAVALSCLSAPASAGEATYRPPAKRVVPTQAFLSMIEPQGETPRLANGKPDFSGEWTGPLPLPYARRRSETANFSDHLAWEHSSWYHRPLYKPEFWEKVEALGHGRDDGDPKYGCGYAGVPRGVVRPSILMSVNQMWIANSAGSSLIHENMLRAVPLDDRPRGEFDSDETKVLGVPLGRWEGDTLVVDSVGFSDETWLAWVGYFHSDRMHLIERFRRDGDLMYYTYTVEDPEVLAEPFTSETMVWRLNPDPKAVLVSQDECIYEKELDEGIVDRYFR